jgi:hypothetical protein
MAPNADVKSYYANPSLTAEITGKVDGEDKKADVFILSHPEIINLMRYV